MYCLLLLLALFLVYDALLGSILGLAHPLPRGVAPVLGHNLDLILAAGLVYILTLPAVPDYILAG